MSQVIFNKLHLIIKFNWFTRAFHVIYRKDTAIRARMFYREMGQWLTIFFLSNANHLYLDSLLNLHTFVSLVLIKLYFSRYLLQQCAV